VGGIANRSGMRGAFVSNISIDRAGNLLKNCRRQFPSWEQSDGRLIF
jgi:hypothetical protein